MHTPDDARIATLIDELVAEIAPRDPRLTEHFLSEVVGLMLDRPDALDAKIADAAVTEMRDAFAVFQPYKGIRKVSIFGSARTLPDSPLYEQARDVAARLAAAGWMVVTGAGPGIMEAGMLGAGRANSIGVSIRLPFEDGANFVIEDDDKHVAMKYFFTRKLMLVKESSAFVCLPGGFGTLDETFELLTLTQTGKGLPVPIVFLDAPDDPFWEQIDEMVRESLIPRGLVSERDTAIYKVAATVDEAVDEITHFYSNFHSTRLVGDDLVIRMHRAPDDAQLEQLNERYAHLLKHGRIRRVEPYSVEVRHNDQLELERIAFAFQRRGYADLRGMIDDLNSY